jgi:alkylhydroperoxidase family enzyme
MCGVAILNGAEYEFFHHAPPFLKAGGTQEQVDAMRHLGQEKFNPDCFSDLENDALELTLQMTRHIKVDPALMERLLNALGSTALVELVGVIASYNMVSRFLIALDIHPEDHPPSS